MKRTARNLKVLRSFHGQLPNVPLGFGVRGLDPALTFGGCNAASRSIILRTTARVRPAYWVCSTLDADSRERKSGVKPPHSKASRHSHVDLAGISKEEWEAAK